MPTPDLASPSPTVTSSVAGTKLVLIEFAGLGANQTFARAVPQRPAGRVIVLDPLSLWTVGEAVPLGELADRLAQVVRFRGVDRVVLAAACTGVSLLAPLAAALTGCGVEVALAAAVAPQAATAEFVTQTMARLAAKLGGAGEELARECREIATDRDERRAGGQADQLFTRCLDGYVAEEGLEQDEETILRAEVLPRYVAWVSFLLSARHPVHSPALASVHVLAGQPVESAPDLFGPACELRTRLFDTDGAPALTHEPLGVELRRLLAGAGW